MTKHPPQFFERRLKLWNLPSMTPKAERLFRVVKSRPTIKEGAVPERRLSGQGQRLFWPRCRPTS